MQTAGCGIATNGRCRLQIVSKTRVECPRLGMVGDERCEEGKSLIALGLNQKPCAINDFHLRANAGSIPAPGTIPSENRDSVLSALTSGEQDARRDSVLDL